MTQKKKIRVVVADDHEIFIWGLGLLLKGEKHIELVGEASNGEELITVAGKLKPDVIIMDVKMPVMDGLKATQQITEKFPSISILALSMFDDEHLIMDMIDAGAKGYLIKNANKSEIISAITSAYNNDSYFCTYSAKRLAKMIGKKRYNPFKENPDEILTEREKEVIRLICQEYANKEIAVALDISVRTVESYREKIFEKTKVKNIAGLVVYAIKHGIYRII